MHFEILHQLHCDFVEPAPLSPQTLRLRPRTDGRQWLESFEMSFDPIPEAFNHVIDAEGNVVTVVWPGGPVGHHEVSVRSRVETLGTNPIDAHLDGSPKSLPYSYPESLKWLLAPARHRSMRRSDDDPVHDFAQRLRRGADNASSFLERLALLLHDQFDHVAEAGGTVQSVSDTLLRRGGTGSDLATLFMEASRAMGLAARFVRGYHAGCLDSINPSDQREPSLHAWAEVFLPGAGWLGFDPTLGCAVGDRHIALAAAADPINAAACSGCLVQDTELTVQASVTVLERAASDSPLVSTKRRRA